MIILTRLQETNLQQQPVLARHFCLVAEYVGHSNDCESDRSGLHHFCTEFLQRTESRLKFLTVLLIAALDLLQNNLLVFAVS